MLDEGIQLKRRWWWRWLWWRARRREESWLEFERLCWFVCRDWENWPIGEECPLHWNATRCCSGFGSVFSVQCRVKSEIESNEGIRM